MKCFACPNKWRSETGHVMRGFEDVRYCGPCFKHFYSWCRGMFGRKWSGSDFYAAAVSSIRANDRGLLDPFGELLSEETMDSMGMRLVYSEALETMVNP